MFAFFDSNVWDFLAMPAGVVICFGPALLVWLKFEYFTKAPEKSKPSVRP